ncbi:hypothetical protein JCM11251_005653, partial [Rhodosporidiobolus azoricus]
TGRTDIPLTAKGEETIRALGTRVVGEGKFLDPAHIKHVFISPRQRARKTYELLFEGVEEGKRPETSTEEGIREWDYGVCEGKVTKDIKAEIGQDWDIWTMGCPEGESPEEMTARCDEMIKRIVDMTGAHHGNEGNAECRGDVLIVSHGHFSRCFVTRWLEMELTHGRRFNAETGALTVCGFYHHSFDERALMGMNLYAEGQ